VRARGRVEGGLRFRRGWLQTPEVRARERERERERERGRERESSVAGMVHARQKKTACRATESSLLKAASALRKQGAGAGGRRAAGCCSSPEQMLRFFADAGAILQPACLMNKTLNAAGAGG